MSRTIVRDFQTEIEFTITDDAPDDVFTRGGTDEWKNFFYPDIDTEEATLEHFAFNCAANGAWDISRLDGWADVPEGAVTMRVLEVRE